MSYLFISNVNDGILVPEAFSELPDSSPTAFTITKLEKKHKEEDVAVLTSCIDELKSAFCSTIYISKQRKFVPLFDFSGTFSICACAKEISPEIPCSVVF